jgi:hypothetical protein
MAPRKLPLLSLDSGKEPTSNSHIMSDSGVDNVAGTMMVQEAKPSSGTTGHTGEGSRSKPQRAAASLAKGCRVRMGDFLRTLLSK